MRADKRLETVLDQVGLPVKYYEYLGKEPVYIVYNEEAEEPVNFGDNRALHSVTWWQVHLFAPKDSEFREHKKKITESLRTEGYAVTDIATLYEKETKTIHVVISCHYGESEE